MSNFCSNSDTELHGFTPFNDAYEQSRIGRVQQNSSVTTNGINTSQIDRFRQGVEITTNKMTTLGTTPKIWSGNTCGFTRVNTYGQFDSYVEYSGRTSFDDKLKKFDPIQFINERDSYPYPLIFNDGPQQKEELSIEPLTIAFRKNTNEDVKNMAHMPRGFIDYGAQADQREPYFYQQQEQCDFFFLDQGGTYFGDGAQLSDKIVVPGYMSSDKDKVRPFDDTRSNGPNQPLTSLLSTTDTDLINLLNSTSMDWNLDEDLRQEYGYRSTSAGSTVYGPNMRRYGTDSLAYTNTYRGS